MRRAVLAAIALLLLPPLAAALPLGVPPVWVQPLPPIYPANQCALLDFWVGEDAMVGAYCGTLRFVDAGQSCVTYDAGIDCHLDWTATVTADLWATPGAVTATFSGSCSDTETRSWLATAKLVVTLQCTTPQYFVARGTCVLVPARIDADFSGAVLSAPDMSLAYDSGLCDRRDPA